MFRGNPFWRRFWKIGIICSAAALNGVSLDQLPQLAAQQPREVAATSGKMRIQVLDSAGQPLPEAKIHVSVWTKEKFAANRDYTCDVRGTADVDLPRTLEILRLWAAKDGFCGMFVSLEPAQGKALVIPGEYAFRLPKGTFMGGVVRNENGQAIARARVELRYVSGRVKQHDNVRPSFSLSDFRMTDADGRWQFDNVPPGDDVQVGISVTHPDYVSDQSGQLQRKQGITSQALRTRAANIVMQRGVSVTGKVTDPDGNPIQGALVLCGDRPYWQPGTGEVRTGEDGVFRLEPLPAGPTRVTIVAPGWMPDSRKFDIGKQAQSADFLLKPGKKLRIRVVDSAGAIVPDVAVSIDQWRGTESLYNYQSARIDTRIPRTADKNGVFEWPWAPDDAVTYEFYKPGFARVTASIAADDSEHVQTIHRLLRISGSVSDAATGKAIDDFLVVPVIFFRPDFPFLNRNDAERRKAGKFGIEFERTDIQHGVQIEAPGYMTFRTPSSYRIGQGDPTIEVRLQPTGRNVGRVLDLAGRPVTGARVYVATAFQHLDLTNLQDRGEDATSNCSVNTNDKGNFEIVGQMERYALVIVAPEGHAEVERVAGQQPGDIRVRPWAKVTGKLVQADKPVANCEVLLEPIRFSGGDEPQMHVYLRGMTGSDGSFVFDRVPPIPCRVRGFLHFSRESPLSSSRSVPLQLAPGEEARVSLGGNGIEVTGQLVAENQPEGFDYHFALSYLVAKRPGIDPTASLAAKGFDWRKGWSDSWNNSQEGRAYLETLHHWFVKPAPDGRFSISGVEPGDYEFAVNLYGTTEGCLVHPIATRLIHISVGSSDSMLDLGKVTIPSLSLPKIGDLAADVELATLDGSKTRLASLHGHYVLLDFWATWCGPCVAKLDEVERLRKQFAEGDRLVVVGMNLDADQERAREFLRAKPLPWQHALLGDWSSTEVPRRFAISSIPSYVLIDPAGRILAQEYSLDEIASKLQSRAAKKYDRAPKP